MTYKFKLAKRLATSHDTIMIVLLVALASCSGGGELKEGFAPPDLSETLETVHTLPDSATLSPGASLQFSAYGLTLAGDSVGVVVRSWTAAGGTISSGGLFQADSIPGVYQVSASAELLNGNPGRQVGQSRVIVLGSGPPLLTGVIVSPDPAVLGAGQPQVFSAVGNMSDGSTSPVAVSWTATGGSIASDGRYQAGTTPGAFVVVATENGGLADTASVTISGSGGPQLTRIDVTPQSMTLSTGQAQSYTAVGRLSDGSNTTATVSWTATGGSISSGGTYVAGTAPGSFRVIAVETSGLADTAQVTVTAQPPPTLQAVVLSPALATLAIGASRQFSATGLMSDGSTTSVSVVYGATGGTISGSGLYSAGAATGSFQVIATETSGLADTASVTLITPPPPPNPGHPNEPAGFTRLYENDYTQPPPASGSGWSSAEPIFGCWSREFGGTHTIRPDPTAPSGDGVAYGLLFNAGIVGGFGPGLVAEWETCAQSGGPEYRRIYYDMWFKLAGGPNGDLSDWDFHGGVNKILGFFGVGRSNSGGNGSDMTGRSWGSGLQTTTELQFLTEAIVLRAFTPNAGSSVLTVGQWHRIEMQQDLNSSPGSSDGTLKIWVDGVLALDYSDVQYTNGANPSGFYQKHNSPTWGGGGGPNKSRDDWIYYDHMYISGVP